MDDSYIDIRKYIKNSEIYDDDYIDKYIYDYFDLYYNNIKMNSNNEIKNYEQFYANCNFIEDKQSKYNINKKDWYILNFINIKEDYEQGNYYRWKYRFRIRK